MFLKTSKNNGDGVIDGSKNLKKYRVRVLGGSKSFEKK